MQQGRNILGLDAQPRAHDRRDARPDGHRETPHPLDGNTTARPAITSGVMSVDMLTGRAMRWSQGDGRRRTGSDA